VLGRAAALFVRLYQLSLGKYLPSRCRFYPSCSEYAVEALRANGLLVGGFQTLWRLLRCAPWSAGGFDPVVQHHHPMSRHSSRRRLSAHG
jgi:putative membrane protein insertion efficiency factor